MQQAPYPCASVSLSAISGRMLNTLPAAPCFLFYVGEHFHVVHVAQQRGQPNAFDQSDLLSSPVWVEPCRYGYDYTCLPEPGATHASPDTDVCRIQPVPFGDFSCSDAAGSQVGYADIMEGEGLSTELPVKCAPRVWCFQEQEMWPEVNWQPWSLGSFSAAGSSPRGSGPLGVCLACLAGVSLCT